MIALFGSDGSGKSTVAELMTRRYCRESAFNQFACIGDQVCFSLSQFKLSWEMIKIHQTS